jgi:hypothetical protein
MKKNRVIESSEQFESALITSKLEMTYDSEELFDKIVLSHYGHISTGDRDERVSADIYMDDDIAKELLKFLLEIYPNEIKVYDIKPDRPIKKIKSLKR